jgi:hypothetical protein
LISNIFSYSIKLCAISSHTKSIQQELYFPWFLKCLATSSKNIVKNKIGIAIKFCKCYIIKRSSSNFLNKTQLKNKNKNWIFFNWVRPGKNIIEIAIKFCKCYVIKRSLSNFLNKTQLKIKIKTGFFLSGSDLVRTKLGLRSNSANATSSSDLLLIFRIKHN